MSNVIKNTLKHMNQLKPCTVLYNLLTYLTLHLFFWFSLPCSSLMTGLVNWTKILPSFPATFKPASGAFMDTLYASSGAICLRAEGRSSTTFFKSVRVGLSAQRTTSWTLVSPRRMRPLERCPTRITPFKSLAVSPWWKVNLKIRRKMFRQLFLLLIKICGFF